MNVVTTYWPSTGEIDRVVKSSDVIHPEMLNGLPFVEGEFEHADYYVLDGQAAARPAMPCTIAGRTISNIPPGSRVCVGQTVYIVDDGVAVLTCDQKVKLEVSVAKFPYKPFVTEVDFGD